MWARKPLLVGAFLSFSASAVDAQVIRRATEPRVVPTTDTVAASPAQIVGFSNIPWGATRAQVITAQGSRPDEVLEQEGLTTLWYLDERVLGVSTDIVFYIHPRHGLVRGGYVSEFNRTSDSDCDRVLRLFEGAVTERYPSIRADRQRRNTSSLSFCGGVLIGDASSRTEWVDPANGTRVVVGLVSEGRFILTLYNSREGQEAGRSADQAEVRRRFR